MNLQVFIGILYGIVVICLGILSMVILRRLGKQTDTLTSITNSFAGISSELKIMIGKIESYEKDVYKRNEGQKELITTSLKNLSDRVERLEKVGSGQLTKLDNDISRLYMHCSRKIERDSLIKD